MRVITTPKSATERMVEILAVLTEKPMTTAEIARAIRLDASTTHGYVMRLRDKKKIYVSGYLNEQGGGKLLSVGNLPDVARVKQSRRSRVKAKRVFIDDFERKPFKVIVRRDPLHAALFGEYRRAA